MTDLISRRPLLGLRSELDRFFGNAFPNLWEEADNGSQMWAPQMDLSEKSNEYLAKMDLPGLQKEDVTVKVEDNQLTVSGERKDEKREEGENFLRVERKYGSFYRSLPVPSNVNASAIDAEIKNGVLMVHMPKTEKSKAKAIKVK